MSEINFRLEQTPVRKNKNYGMPYQGSKSKIIDKISVLFPDSENFYDLFGGGFSVSHYMILHRSKSYKTFHYNELRPGLCELIKDAINGKYNYDVFKPEWISRERFFAEKETSAYIKIIWSFGNNGRDYLFGKEIEKKKQSMHMAVVFNQFDSFMKDEFGISEWPNHLTVTGKRLYLKRLVNQRIELQQLQQLQQLEQLERLQQLQQLQRLEQLERLEKLQQLERLEQLEMTNLDYREVKIKPNSIIYCDIPYKGTADYGNSFNHDEFFDWADAQENPVFISEYKVDDGRFKLLKEIEHRSTLSASASNKTKECVFINKAAQKMIGGF